MDITAWLGFCDTADTGPLDARRFHVDAWARAMQSPRAAPRTAAPWLAVAATAGPTHGTPGEGPRRLSALTSPLADGQSLPASQEREDCGALIGDLVRHQAWHWRVERQLSRAILRSVEGTGQ